jgi:hypothetical protein
LYIADDFNERIRRVTSVDTPKTIINSGISLQIYPNPATTSLTIVSSSTINQIGIIDVLGQRVYNNGYNANKVLIDLSNLSAAVYFVKVNGSEVRKFVKE